MSKFPIRNLFIPAQDLGGLSIVSVTQGRCLPNWCDSDCGKQIKFPITSYHQALYPLLNEGLPNLLPLIPKSIGISTFSLNFGMSPCTRFTTMHLSGRTYLLNLMFLEFHSNTDIFTFSTSKLKIRRNISRVFVFILFIYMLTFRFNSVPCDFI